MDDILVNIEPGRARKAAEAIQNLSRSHQVLLFTCHPQTVELLRQIDDRVSVRRLEEGRIGISG